jgi:outer membrane protein assembly factor BamB
VLSSILNPPWRLDRPSARVELDPSKPYTITQAPRVIKGRVVIGNRGSEYGVRGYISAYDAETGELAWRFFTVPGDPAQPVEIDGSRIAFVNSVGGDMAAALNVGLNEKDPGIFGVHHLPAWFTIPLAPVL